MHGRQYVETKHELLLRHDAFVRHKIKIQELMNDKFEDFHKGNRQAEESLKRLNDQKSRTFFFNKGQRDNQIEKDNMNLLAKLETIKKKGTAISANGIKKRNKSIIESFKDPERVRCDQQKVAETKRKTGQQSLENQNIKLAFHIHQQSSSIDVRKQLNDFNTHQRMLDMHGKYKNNKVWGGAVGSVGHRQSPRKIELKQHLKLPPLGAKPIFGDEKIGRLTISEANMPKLAGKQSKRNYNNMMTLQDDQRPSYQTSDMKPHTANISNSMKQFDQLSGRTPKAMRRTHQQRNASVSHNEIAINQPSEFNLQLLKIREREVEVMKAIETSDMLISLKGPASTRHLKEISTQSRFATGITGPHSGHNTSIHGLNSQRQSNYQMQSMTGPVSSMPSMQHTGGDRTPFQGTSSNQTSMPAMQAQLASLQQKIDNRQGNLDDNEDRIANIILNSPGSQGSDEQKEPEAGAEQAKKEEDLREKDIIQDDVHSEADTDKKAAGHFAVHSGDTPEENSGAESVDGDAQDMDYKLQDDKFEEDKNVSPVHNAAETEDPTTPKGASSRKSPFREGGSPSPSELNAVEELPANIEQTLESHMPTEQEPEQPEIMDTEK